MSIIGQGRSAGGYAVIQNSTLDGLLQHGGVDLAGFYLALKRFIDRRQGPTSNQTMDWSIKYFCTKFTMGQQRFYRLAEKLWQLGLLDVEKVISPDGWQNKYLVHDYPPYQGPLRLFRQGSFKYRKGEGATFGEDEEQGKEAPVAVAAFRQETCAEVAGAAGDDGSREGIAGAGIPKSGIPESDIPKADIPAAGIPAADTLRKNNVEEKDKGEEKDNGDEKPKGWNPSVRQSVYHHEPLGQSKRPTDGRIDFGNPRQVTQYYAQKFGATERQVILAILAVQAQLDKGTVIMDTKAYFEKTLTQLLQEEDFRKHFV